jgi:Type II secretion system (T2SS), protein M subtype b
MRDQLANLFARLRAATRQERLYLALGAVAVLVVLRFGVGWLVEYRRGVKEDIQLTADRLANAKRTVLRGPELETRLAELRQRYEETLAHLVPGDTPTLAAAALQDRVSSLAAEKGVSLQTTQVMRDEAMGPFRKVTLRITANGDLRQLADFIAQLEFGELRVNVPFIELNRRGAVRRDNMVRAVSATIEVNGIVQGSARVPRSAAVTPAAAAGEETSGLQATAPLGGVFGGPPGLDLGAQEAPLEIPADPLGTAEQGMPSP